MKMPVNEMLDFRGKVVVVTGAGQGMGVGIARRFGQAGATVALTCRSSREKAEAVRDEIRGYGVPAQVFQLDQSSPEDCARMIAEVAAAFGRVDVLVNNAGININRGTLDLEEDVWDRVMDTNVKGFFFCSRAAAKQMIAQGSGGSIVSIASINGYTPLPDGAHYGASKAGIIMGTGWRERYVSRAPLGRIGDWEDVGNVCLFLASPMAGWVTGQTIIADGGVVLAPAY